MERAKQRLEKQNKGLELEREKKPKGQRAEQKPKAAKEKGYGKFELVNGFSQLASMAPVECRGYYALESQRAPKPAALTRLYRAVIKLNFFQDLFLLVPCLKSRN